jgi:hypothetical protein
VPLEEPAITQVVKIAGPRGRNVEDAGSSMASTLGAKFTLAFGASRPPRPA